MYWGGGGGGWGAGARPEDRCTVRRRPAGGRPEAGQNALCPPHCVHLALSASFWPPRSERLAGGTGVERPLHHLVLVLLLLLFVFALLAMQRSKRRKKKQKQLEDIQPIFQTETWRKLN